MKIGADAYVRLKYANKGTLQSFTMNIAAQLLKVSRQCAQGDLSAQQLNILSFHLYFMLKVRKAADCSN